MPSSDARASGSAMPGIDMQPGGMQQADVPQLGVQRVGESLRFTGPLLRVNGADAWTRALPQLAGVRHFDLGAVTRVDSAGVALLAALMERAGAAQACEITLEGSPPGLAELRGAYRLTPALGFTT